MGKLCKNPVMNSTDCSRAANVLTGSTSVNGNGMGYDLPYGCISYKISPKKDLIFWNPLGVAISEDPKIRQVCSNVKVPGGK